MKLNKIKGALYGASIGDSLSMPVHWYYDPRQLNRDFGKITGYGKQNKKLSLVFFHH